MAKATNFKGIETLSPVKDNIGFIKDMLQNCNDKDAPKAIAWLETYFVAKSHTSKKESKQKTDFKKLVFSFIPKATEEGVSIPALTTKINAGRSDDDALDTAKVRAVITAGVKAKELIGKGKTLTETVTDDDGNEKEKKRTITVYTLSADVV